MLEILFTKNVVVAYAFKAPDYIAYHIGKVLPSGQSKENGFGTNKSCTKTKHRAQKCTGNEREYNGHRRTNNLVNDLKEIVADEIAINAVRYKLVGK